MILLKYVDGRVQRVTSLRYSDLFSSDELEELVGEVVCKLMSGALARFQGDSMPALYAFVRTITDRTVNEAAHRRIREQSAREQLQTERLISLGEPAPALEVRVDEVPLSESDQAYLTELLLAGSKAALAHSKGQSRAAVTRMVQRIRARIEELPPDERLAVEAWMHQVAHRALASPASPDG
jgi:hypothetical protein